MASRSIPVAIVFVVAMIILVDNFFPGPVTKPITSELLTWAVLLGAFALVLGAVNLVRINLRKLQGKGSERLHAASLLAGALLFSVAGIAGGGPNSPLYKNLFQYIISPFGQAFWGVVLFFLVSASYRGFVAKRWQAAVILVSGLIYMLGQVPIGEILVPGITKVARWLQDIPNNAGQRGIIIGAAVGAIVLQIRVILGIERGHFGGQ